MAKLKILAQGQTERAKSQARGKLFERLMETVLSANGYQVEEISNVNYAGMEIDINGTAKFAGCSLYAECKCHDTDVGSSHIQRFFGKYMTRWLREPNCQGLFVALPGLNSHAKGFYRESCEAEPRISFTYLEEDDVLDAMYGAGIMVKPEVMASNVDPAVGKIGDYTVLYTDLGCFAVQYIISPGATLADCLTILDSAGVVVRNNETLDTLIGLYPDLREFKILSQGPRILDQESLSSNHLEQIVEVRGSSACFEYQFPASPEHFVGRTLGLDQIQTFVNQVVSKQTSARGLVFEGYSGWGKSSLVLASVKALEDSGHLAVAIDSRTASSSQFALRAIHHALRASLAPRLPVEPNLRQSPLTGLDGAIDTLLQIGRVLELEDRVLVIFFDQFENVLALPEAASRVRDVFAKVLDAHTNIAIGFSWKTDLIGSTDDFPYQVRDTISNSSHSIRLELFSKLESDALLERLGEELRTPVREDLKFFLSEFSQGYPWLLKKLCAHVKAQREAGVSQQNIVDSLLNVEQLFLDDLKGLSADQEYTLKRIAQLAPVSVSEIGEEFNPDIIQSLIDSRLVVRIGPMYDIYWDIFRDYLNGGALPVQENYILHSQGASIFKHCRVLADNGGNLDVEAFRDQAGLRSRAYYNVVREMRLLGLATFEDDQVALDIPMPAEDKDLEEIFREHLRDKLRRNRLVSSVLSTLENDGTLTVQQVSKLLQDECPYISANTNTWNLYARTMCSWMAVADLVTYNKNAAMIEHYSPASTLRQNNILEGRNRTGILIPQVQCGAIETVSERLVDALDGTKRIDWSGVAPSTRTKGVSALEQLGLVRRRPGSIVVTAGLREFARDPDNRQAIFAERAILIRAFTEFVAILENHQGEGAPLDQIGLELMGRLNASWKKSTAEAHAKVLLNWSRYAGLAPGVFAMRRRGKRNQGQRAFPMQGRLGP